MSIARVTRPAPLSGGPMASLTASSTAVQTAMLFTGSPAMAMAEVCARLGRYTFQFVVAPPRIAGTTAVPVNPLAVF